MSDLATWTIELPPPRLEPTPRWIRVRAGDTEVANSRRALLLTWYGPGMLPTYCLPAEDVRTDLLQPTGTLAGDGLRRELLVPSDAASRCPYKGTATHWSVRVGAALHQDVAWTYPEPVPECPRIAGLVAFFNEKVDLVLDGVHQERPRTPWSS